MRHLALASATLFAAALYAGDADPVKPAVASEPYDIGNQKVPVSSKKDLTIKADDPVEVATRELWYARFDGKAWGAWQKHGITFSRETPITWAAPEGHWRVYVRRILTSGLTKPEPGLDTKPHGEFVIDRTAPTAAIGFPATKQKLRGGDKYTVKWEASDPYLRNAPIAVKWSRDGNSWETVAENLPNSGSYDWTVPMAMTTSGQVRIEAMDKAGNLGQAEVSGIIVDSVRPKGKVTGPAISAKAELALDLEVSDSGPSGLTAARLWISQDDGGSWTEGPFIQDPFKSVAWKAPADGRFRLAVVATDGAGNQSPVPKGKADEGQFVLTVDTVAPVVLLSSVIGILPADAAKATNRRDFKPGDRVQVPFTVKDANLQANSATVYLQSDPGKPWIELGKGLATDAAFRFEIAKDAVATKSARIKVTAVDLAGNVGEAVATESFTIQTDVQDGGVSIDLGN